MEDTGKGQETSVAFGSLEQVGQQLQEWRAGRKLGERIPAALWAAAVGAAREHGLYRVAIELRLDYAALKRRVERAGEAAARIEVAPRFVELFTAAAPTAAAAAARPECVVELHSARGATMRVELTGQGLAGLAGLCSAFWSA